MDPQTVNLLLGLLVGLILGGGLIGLGFGILRKMGLDSAKDRAQSLLREAQTEIDSQRRTAEIEAREAQLARRAEHEVELEKSRRRLREEESRIERREAAIELKQEHGLQRERELEAIQRTLVAQKEDLDRRHGEVKQLLANQRENLAKLARMTSDEARTQLLERIEAELSSDLGERVLRFEAGIRETSAARAREILATSIQRYAASHTAETTVSTVDIPSEDIKGRIIGREGRNIRAFEKATGVDVIVDDTPGIVIVTGFDNVRREVAKLSLQKLIQDGRIHPGRIEEIVAETQHEMDQHILDTGREAAHEVGIVGLHEKLLHYLGRLKFRTSYSQNVLRHSIEVAFLTGMLAEELGYDCELGRRCGLLHDIGKAADHEMEGGHPLIGSELCKRFGEGADVAHAALGHHDDVRIEHPYTVLVASADAISASRPGARRDTLEKYVRRLEDLEALASGFPGVDHAYAIQAGRELRILVDSAQIDDPSAAKLCRDIAKAIEDQLTYPGEVKVTVLRETRSVEFAR